jgi:hypothetical protein
MSSIALATLMLVSLFAVASSPASVSGQASGTTAPLAPNLVGGTMTGTGPAASTSFTTGQTEIFAVDANGALWNTTITSSGNGTWNSLGGMCTSSPAVVSWNSSYFRIDVFVRGTDGAIWWRDYQNGSWSGWNSLSGQAASGTGPAVASWSAGRLDVFVEGTNGALWHKSFNGATWSSWQSLGGKLTSAPAATSPTSGVIDVFARGSDGAVWYKEWNGAAWSSWHSLGGQVAPNTGPAVSQALWLFVQGTDSQLWRTGVGAGSAKSPGWGTLGGAPPEALSTSSPGAVVLTSGETLVCVSSTSGNVWYSADSLANWKDWGSAGTPPVINTTYHPELTQGIATDGTYNYGISNTALYKYDANWTLIMTNGNAAAQCGGNHMGAGTIYNGTLYVICTEDSPAPELAYVGLFNTSHLSVIKRVDLTKVAGNPPAADQMNIGAVGVNPDAGLLLGLQFGPYGSTTPSPAEVFTFNLTSFAYEGHIQASNFSTIYNQGISYYDGHYYYSYGNLPVGGVTSVNGGVAIMNTDGSNATQIIPASRMMAGGGTDEIEGLYVTNGGINVLRGGYVYTFPFQAQLG